MGIEELINEHARKELLAALCEVKEAYVIELEKGNKDLSSYENQGCDKCTGINEECINYCPRGIDW